MPGNPGYPRFQGKNRYDRITYLQGGYKLDRKHLKLFKIDDVRNKLHRQMDLGMKQLAITSEGECFEYPKYLRKAEKRLKSHGLTQKERL